MAQAGETRLLPPEERRIVSRTRLLRKLDRAGSRTVLVTAPAGYGKTTLARQWLERAGGAWLSLGAASRDVPVLARDLARSLAEICAVDARRVELALSSKSVPSEQAKAVARAILEQVPQPVEGWLVVDDYHLLVGAPAAEELLALLERGGRFKLLVTSRERPRWVTARRIVHLEALELDASELALDDEETAELLPLNSETAALREQAHGWPAVIALAAHAHRTSVPSAAAALSTSLYDYFADELFERASEPARRYLTAIALLPALSADELGDLLQESEAAGLILATGLAHRREGLIGVHPLARAFLLTKAHARPDAAELARAGIDFATSRGLWDEAFELIREFAAEEALDGLIAASYTSLIETGRIATLEALGRYAAAHGPVSQSLLDLIEAEVALRDGAFDRAIALGKAAADAMAASDVLKARGYVAAGIAAHLDHQLEEAFNLHSTASRFAATTSDSRASAWGRCLAALSLERSDMKKVVREFEGVVGARAEDRLRVFIARQHLAILTDGLPDLSAEARSGAGLVEMATDPWVRTAWGNALGYSLMLQGRYEEASAILLRTLREIDEFHLSFGRRHVEWTLASAELGLRHFARCDALLRRVERHTDALPDSHIELNSRVLRARLLLAQQRPQEALDQVIDDFRSYPARAMYGEYLATRAIAFAVLGDSEQAISAATRANELTRSVETRLLSLAAHGIVSLGTNGASKSCETLLEAAARLGIWDGVVCAARSSPDLAVQLALVPQYRMRLQGVLLRSRDAALAKKSGLQVRSRPTQGVLSKREVEVIDLLRQGHKNKEIAATLFISSATVKVHVQHIFDKLGARTRAEAVARYAEIETG